MSTVLPAINALGTTWFVELFEEISNEKADETYGLISFFMSNFEATYSRFKPDSIISTVNRTKLLTSPDQTTLDLLRLGQQFYKDTYGVFNLLVGEHLVARGYDADYSFVAKIEPVDFPNPLIDLVVTNTDIILKSGLIDLGGYGKGFLIDRLAKLLQEHGFQYFLINGGGDMYATSDHEKPVTIYLEHPSEPSTYIAETSLKDQGFAASSTHKRSWKVSGKEYSHIVNTAQTEVGVAMDEFGIYTKAPKAVLADTWSTTLLISKPDEHKEALTFANVSFARFNSGDSTLQKSPYF